MARHDPSQRFLRKCPVCRAALVAERTETGEVRDDLFNCFDCGTVVHLRSSGNKPSPGDSTDGKS